jgi:hypothetical protein
MSKATVFARSSTAGAANVDVSWRIGKKTEPSESVVLVISQGMLTFSAVISEWDLQALIQNLTEAQTSIRQHNRTVAEGKQS